jgi:hypothetical protein
MKIALSSLVAMLLVGMLAIGMHLAVEPAAAQITPNIPPSDLPGRERQRFQESPLDRFTDPLAKPREAAPLWHWECKQRTSRRSDRRKRATRC